MLKVDDSATPELRVADALFMHWLTEVQYMTVGHATVVIHINMTPRCR